MSKICNSNNWKEVKRERILPFASVVSGQVPGVPFDMVQIESKDSVIIVPCTKNGALMMTEARPPYGSGFQAFPAGKVEENEDPEATALRELLEETGLEAKSMRLLGSKRLFHHICSEVVYIYLAEVDPNYRSSLSLEEGELIEEQLTEVSWTEMRGLIHTEQLDGVSVTAALWALLEY